MTALAADRRSPASYAGGGRVQSPLLGAAAERPSSSASSRSEARGQRPSVDTIADLVAEPAVQHPTLLARGVATPGGYKSQPQAELPSHADGIFRAEKSNFSHILAFLREGASWE